MSSSKDPDDLELKRLEGVKLIRADQALSETAMSFHSDQSGMVDRVVECYYNQFRWIQVDENTNLNTNMFQAVL